MTNPWIAKHLSAERAFTGDDAERLVNNEYQGTDIYDTTCGLCNAPAFWRATVGAVQCPKCRALLITRIDQATGHITERWVA